MIFPKWKQKVPKHPQLNFETSESGCTEFQYFTVTAIFALKNFGKMPQPMAMPMAFKKTKTPQISTHVYLQIFCIVYTQARDFKLLKSSFRHVKLTRLIKQFTNSCSLLNYKNGSVSEDTHVHTNDTHSIPLVYSLVILLQQLIAVGTVLCI